MPNFNENEEKLIDEATICCGNNMQELKQIYYESGIWRKYNWYDFLKELCKIIQKYAKRT